LAGVSGVDGAVTPEALLGRRVRGGEQVKILGNGEVTQPFTVYANDFSASAERAILACGGKAVRI